MPFHQNTIGNVFGAVDLSEMTAFKIYALKHKPKNHDANKYSGLSVVSFLFSTHIEVPESPSDCQQLCNLARELYKVCWSLCN